MKLLLGLIVVFVLTACNSNGKIPEYSSRWIDRPYSLPEGLMKGSLQASFQRLAVSSKEYSITGKAEAANYTLPIFDFDVGISENFTYSAIVGFKWRLYHDDRHSFGISASTLILYNTFSADYWFRASDSFSIRPYYRAMNLNLILAETSSSIPGVEVLFQMTDNWGLSGYYQKGRYRSRSEFVELIVTGVSGASDYNSELKGSVSEFGLSTIYSLTPRWDLRGQTGYATYDLDPVRLHAFNLSLGFNHFF